MKNLCDFEIDVLRECNGEKVSGLSWGAAMSVALECLESSGLIERCTSGYSITELGKRKLESASSSD